MVPPASAAGQIRNMTRPAARGAGRSFRLARAAGLLLALVLPLLAAEAAKADDYFTTDTAQYQQNWTPPEGVIATTVWLWGANGGGVAGEDDGEAVGGLGGFVVSKLTDLSPDTSLTVCLSGRGSRATALHGGGGIGGGGNAPLGAYGGGGSTDIRLAASCSVGADTRLLIAGGGGGMGGQSSDGSVGGYAGNGAGGPPTHPAQAGVPYGDEIFTHVTGGGGGGLASTSANGIGGPGGVAGNTDATSDVNIGAAGGSGLGGVGGSGGQPASGLPDEGWQGMGFFSAGGGGGGGGGYFAGGGGGGGGFYRGGGVLNLVPPGATGGGGGGAGSNCGPELPVHTTCGGLATSITATYPLVQSQNPGNGDGYVQFVYPEVSIHGPAADTSFPKDGPAFASFSCLNEWMPGVPTCVGIVTRPDSSTVSVSSGDALPTDIGGTYTLSITATDFYGGTRRLTRSYSVVAPTPPANTGLPTISGTPVVGETLEATPGSWTGTAPILYSYRWQTCHLSLPCVDIDGEAGSGATHTVSAADRGGDVAGDALRVIVTATNDSGSVSATSEKTMPVKFRPELPSGKSVVISGVLEEGQTLTQTFSAGFPLSPDFEYVVQWRRCSTLICVWEAIPGATGPSYVLTGDDVGATISVVVQLKSYSILSQPYGAVTGPIAPRDDQGPELSLTPAATDAVAGTGWFNRQTSGTDGIAIDVAAADPSGVASLVCRDGNDVVLNIDDANGSIVLGDGRHAIECVAIDNRSNTTTASAQFDVDQTAPVVIVPAPITVSATGPAGAAVNYDSRAVDNLDPFPALVCTPASGEVFPIGTTTVICRATDDAGNSAIWVFTVKVLSAAEQIDLLLTDATGIGTGTSLADKVKQIQKAMAAGRTRNACTGLTEFLNLVNSQAAKGKLTGAQAASLTAQADRIKATLTC